MSSGTRQLRVRILARSLYRDLVSEGFDHGQVISLAAELIGAVTAQLANARRVVGVERR